MTVEFVTSTTYVSHQENSFPGASVGTMRVNGTPTFIFGIGIYPLEIWQSIF